MLTFIKDCLALTALVVWGALWLVWQTVRLPFRYLKTLVILVLSFINIASFLTSASREQLLAFEFQRLVMVDQAQRFTQRALGLAEMEAMRANDMQERMKLLQEELVLERVWNAELKSILDKAGVSVEAIQ